MDNMMFLESYLMKVSTEFEKFEVTDRLDKLKKYCKELKKEGE